jgi:hypothetical protein
MKLKAFSTVAAALLCSAGAAAEYTFIPKLGYAQKFYSLDMGDGFPSNKDTITATATGVVWGLTVAHSSKWYFDFEQFDGTGTHKGFVENDDDFIRSEVTFSFGRAFGDGYTGFMGFRHGGSEFRYPHYDETGDLDNDATGVFIGAAKRFNLDATSNVSLSAGIAALTAEFKSFHTDPDIDAKGDTIGYSLGAAWNKRVMQKWNVSLGGRYQAYKYDDVKDSETVIGDQAETISAIYAKVGYIF